MAGKGTIRWLSEEALKRYQRLRTSTHVPSHKETVSEVRKTRGGAILDLQDIIKDVLDDNDFVSVGKSRLRSSFPSLSSQSVSLSPYVRLFVCVDGERETGKKTREVLRRLKVSF